MSDNRVIEFIIPGKPFPKKRPRLGKGGAFNPKENSSFDKIIGFIANTYIKKPFEGAVRIRIKAYFKVSKSWSQKKKDSHIGKPHLHTPDFDNLEKAICDGLNKIAYNDDRQISDARTIKRWSTESYTLINISEDSGE